MKINVINKMVLLILLLFFKFSVKTLEQVQKIKMSKDIKGDFSKIN